MPKLVLERLSQKCPMTFPTMFQASSVYKSCKWKYSSAYMGTKGDQLQCRHLCQKFGVEGLSKQCPMTFQQYFRPLVCIKVANLASLKPRGVVGGGGGGGGGWE